MRIFFGTCPRGHCWISPILPSWMLTRNRFCAEAGLITWSLFSKPLISQGYKPPCSAYAIFYRQTWPDFGKNALELISKIQRDILAIFPKVLDADQFYLTGGTALSYFYLKHRQSRDLDFFTPKREVIEPFGWALQKKLADQGIETQRQRGSQSFLELIARRSNESTIVQLALDATFSFEPMKGFPEFPELRVNDLTDLASNKLLALFGRAMLRDFMDVYFIVHEAGWTKEQLLERSKIKDPGFDLYWLGVALERMKTYRQDSPEMQMLIKPLSFESMSKFFDEWRRQIAGQLKGA